MQSAPRRRHHGGAGGQEPRRHRRHEGGGRRRPFGGRKERVEHGAHGERHDVRRRLRAQMFMPLRGRLARGRRRRERGVLLHADGAQREHSRGGGRHHRARDLPRREPLPARAHLPRLDVQRRAAHPRGKGARRPRDGGDLPALLHADGRGHRNVRHQHQSQSAHPRGKGPPRRHRGLEGRHARLHRHRPRAPSRGRQERGIRIGGVRHQRAGDELCALLHAARQGGCAHPLRTCRQNERRARPHPGAGGTKRGRWTPRRSSPRARTRPLREERSRDG